MRIHDLAVGRAIRDVIPDGERFRIRFLDGLEVTVEWASSGPEIVTFATGVVTSETDLHPQFRYIIGKVVKAVWTDGTQLLIEFTDGHCLRSDFKTSPKVEGVDVHIVLPLPVESIGAAGRL